MINEEVRHIIEPELQKGEELLWADKPLKHPSLLAALWLFGFSIVFLCGVLFMGGVIIIEFLFPDKDAETSRLFWMFVAPFFIGFLIVAMLQVRLGLILLFGHKKQAYAITNIRGIIIDGFLSRRVVSLGPTVLSFCQRAGKDHIGSLHFSSARFTLKESMEGRPASAFFNISNPKKVEGLILKTFLMNTSS